MDISYYTNFEFFKRRFIIIKTTNNNILLDTIFVQKNVFQLTVLI